MTNGEDLRKWTSTIVTGVCGAAIAALWVMVQSQMAALGTQISDLRIDVRVLQSQVAEQKGAFKGLEQRVQDLVDTLNQRDHKK